MAVEAGIAIWIFITIGVAGVWGWTFAKYHWRMSKKAKKFMMLNVKFTSKQMRELKENVRQVMGEQRREMGYAYLDEEDSNKKLPDWLTR